MTAPRAGGGLIRSSALVAMGTGLSRVTGLVRTMALAYALGADLLGSTYNLANNTPNVIYDLILGGVLAATLIPVMVDRFDHDDRKAIDALATVITVGLVALTALAMVAAPAIIGLYSAFDDDPAQVERQATLAVPLLVLFLPQVLFYGLTALWTAVLNARRSFAVPAFAPVLNNVVVVAVLLALPRVAGGDVTFDQVADDPGLIALLGLGTTAGIVAMTLVLWPAMRRAGIRLRWNPDWRNPALRTVARLSAWTLGYVAANQVVFLVVLALLNGLPGESEVAAYTYAWQFFQLPVGLFTVSIMTTFTPELALHAGRGALAEYRRRFSQGARMVLLLVLPTTAILLTLAAPIITVLLQRGDFDAGDTVVTSSALAWLAVGLPGFTTFLFAMRGFYAFKDTRTPFWLNLLENGLQLALSFALVGAFGMQGIIASFSIAYTVAAVVALVVLRARAGGLGGTALPVGALRQLVAATAAAGAVFAVTRVVDGDGTGGALVLCLAGGLVGLATYVVVLVVLRSDDLALLRDLRHRSPAEPSAPPVP
jgi:putative peptidoglycan lipid II flippase